MKIDTMTSINETKRKTYVTKETNSNTVCPVYTCQDWGINVTKELSIGLRRLLENKNRHFYILPGILFFFLNLGMVILDVCLKINC